MKNQNLLITLLLLCAALSFTIAGCKKDDDDDNNSTQSADVYFTGTVNGSSVDLKVISGSGVELTSSSNAQTGLAPAQASYGFYLGKYDSNDDPIDELYVSMQTITSPGITIADADFISFFTTGQKDYVLLDNLGPNGVIVGLVKAGVHYTSLPPAGTQLDSTNTFNVISASTSSASATNEARAKIKAEFKCKVYELDSLFDYTGASSTAQGTFQSYIEKI